MTSKSYNLKSYGFLLVLTSIMELHALIHNLEAFQVLYLEISN